MSRETLKEAKQEAVKEFVETVASYFYHNIPARITSELRSVLHSQLDGNILSQPEVQDFLTAIDKEYPHHE